jgi:hypothetical protein
VVVSCYVGSIRGVREGDAVAHIHASRGGVEIASDEADITPDEARLLACHLREAARIARDMGAPHIFSPPPKLTRLAIPKMESAWGSMMVTPHAADKMAEELDRLAVGA